MITFDDLTLMNDMDRMMPCGMFAEGVAASSPRAIDKMLQIALGDQLCITWGGVLSQKAGVTLRDFRLDGFGLLFVNRGTLQVLVNGDPLTVPKGHVLLLWPGESCVGTQPHETDLTCQYLAFTVEQSQQRLVTQMVDVPRTAKVNNPTRVAEMFRLLIDEYHASQDCRDTWNPLASPSTSLLLMSLLSRLNVASPEKPLASNALTALVERAKDYIRANIEHPISAGDVAKAMDCSTGYLRKAFQHACGCSPSNYMLDRRIYEAKALLAETRLPIGQIAKECGFGSLSYFTRMFTRTEGVTPREYRITHSHSYKTPGI